MFPLNDFTPGTVCHTDGISQKQKVTRERERRSVTVSTGPWEYYTGYSVQKTENKINSRKRIFIK